jgi:general secretion pathway protein D
VTSGGAVAQQRQPAPSAQPGQQGQAPQPPQPFQQQQQGQPLLVVPAAPAAPVLPRVDPDLPTVELLPLLDRVERSSNKRFLADVRLGSRIYLGSAEPEDVTYPVLLAILRLNGWAAFESAGYVNIVPDANIRFHAPVVQTDDASIPPDLYVTRVLTTVNIPTAYLVPVLRPLMSQAAHLASSQTGNQLIVEDRYENVQRIAEIVRTLDVPGAPPLQPVRD